MEDGRSSRLRRPRAALVVALLLLTLGLFAVLAYQAWEAARSHRATAEGTLRDYATFAAWEFGRGAERQLDGILFMSIRQLMAASPAADGDAPLPAPSAVGEIECDCVAVPPRYYFRVDLKRRALVTSPNAPRWPERIWLRDSVAAHARGFDGSHWPQTTLLRTTADGRTHVVAYHLKQDESGAPRTAYGLVADLDDLRPVLADVAARTTLLPPSIAPGLDSDSLLVIRVDAGSRTVYRSDVRSASPYTAVDSLAPRFGGLTARLTLRPERAETLVIGGLPGSRLPGLLVLVVLAAGLVFMALYLLRREHELARLRADFISSTSHELRTPLAQILIFAEMLLLGRVRSEAERRHALGVIVQETRRLKHLVANVLRVSQTERRVSRIEPEPTEIAPLLADVADSFAPLARARDVDVRFEVDERLVAVVDRDALRQILLNLLDNAVKYGSAGQEVNVSAVVADGRLRIRVDDEGPGIPRSQRERVWESFSRLDRDAESAVAGSGIGLAVVRDLAALHEGRARVEDSPGGGARFVVELADAWRGPGESDVRPAGTANPDAPSERPATTRGARRDTSEWEGATA